MEKFGRIDYAVNCAGVLGKPVPSGEMEVSEFERVNGVNYRGVWLCGRREVRVMMGQDPLEEEEDGCRKKIPRERGSIVHIASQLGIVGRPEARELLFPLLYTTYLPNLPNIRYILLPQPPQNIGVYERC